MDKGFRENKELVPITHKEFNEFIKGKGFTGRNIYKLKDLKAMFGFKPMITGSPVTISSYGTEPTRFNSMSKASTSTGIPYVVHLLKGYHSNADNKFMDDHKTDISFEGKNGSKKEY